MAKKRNITTSSRTAKKLTFECEHCFAVYKTEGGILRHQCKKKEKNDILKTKIGLKAFEYYQMWFKLKRMRVHSIETFASSKYFNSFIKFTEYVEEMGLSDPESFIKLMIFKKMSPLHWKMREAYEVYLNEYNSIVTPKQQVDTSVNLLIKIAKNKKIDISEVFSELYPGEILDMIQHHKVSLWLLMLSPKFHECYAKYFSKEQKMIGKKMGIDPSIWQKQFNKNEDMVKYVNMIVNEMRI